MTGRAGDGPARLGGGLQAGLRFLRTDGGYHAAALTYYLILALFPAGALIYALLGIFGAESAVDDAAEELAQRGFDRQYVNAVRETIESAVTQRSHEAWIVVAISVVAALHVASQWVRGVGRGVDAVLERPHASTGLGPQLRDALALVLLFSGAVLLQFGGSRIATGVLGEGFTLWQVAAYLLAAIAGRAPTPTSTRSSPRRRARRATRLRRPRWRACSSGSP